MALAALLATAGRPALAQDSEPADAHIAITDSKRCGEVLDDEHPVSFVCVSAYPSSMAVDKAARLAATVDLPEPIEPTQLAALLLDQPRTYAVVDVRPAWQYREYHVPGAVNVDPDELLAHVKSLPRSARVVLVDRDGTLAWAIGGAVSAALGPESRLLRVVAGGTARFWREVEVVGHARRAAQGAPAMPAAAPSPAAASAAKPETKKRSAGC